MASRNLRGCHGWPRVFIDADKQNYLAYLKSVLGENGDASRPSLLNAGGLIVADNTLWKGLVLAQVKCASLAPRTVDALS